MNKNNSDLNEKSTAEVIENNSAVEEATDKNVAEVKENETTDVEDNVEEVTAQTTDVEPTSDSTTETKEEEKKPESTAETKPASTVIPATPQAKKPEEKSLVLKNLDLNFVYDIMSVPTISSAEYRMVTRIVLWARENNVNYEFDKYGNIYLTKGELEEGEAYPCVTSHLDTAQQGQGLYAQIGLPLELKQRINTKGGHELYVDGTGIGADDKAGVLISLSLFKYFDKLKACFFLEEEIGCKGSKNLNKAWFDNVGYVIGWDSPDRNRAAYSCSGELLFGKELFELVEDTCKENGVTVFNAEPFTDVKEIRVQTEVVCMNFGNGGYNPHMPTEYIVIEDADGACGLGIALIKKLGLSKFRMKSKSSYGATSTDEDVKYINSKFKKTSTYGSNYNYNYGGYNNRGTSYQHTSRSTTSTVVNKPENKVDTKIFEHVVNRYEKYIEDIRMKVETREELILQGIKDLCKEGCTDYAEFVKLFTENSSAEPFSTAIEF